MGLAGSALGAALGVGWRSRCCRRCWPDCCRWTCTPLVVLARGRARARASGSGWRWSSRCSRCSPSAGSRRSWRCAGTSSPSPRPARSLALARRAAPRGAASSCSRRCRWGAGATARSSPRASAVALLVLWGASVGADARGPALASRRLAVRLAPGPGQPVPPGQPDRHRRARARLRRLPARHALPGAAQPAPRAPGHRRLRRGPTSCSSTSSPTSSARSRQALRRRPAHRRPRRCRSCRCGSRSVKGRPVAPAARRHRRRGETAGGAAGRPARVPLAPIATRWSASERLVGGTVVDARRGQPRRSPSSADLADELGVGVGDEIVWDVQGVAAAHPRREPPRGGLGPLRAQLLRGLRAGRAGGGAADAA